MNRFVILALVVLLASSVGCRKKNAPDADPPATDPGQPPAPPKGNTPAVETLRARGALLFDDKNSITGPVISARLSGAKFGDADVALLKSIPTLQTVILGNSKVTDDGLAALKELPVLTTLDVSGTGVTDSGLAHLRAVPNLRRLQLGGTAVTDAGVDSLKSFPNLGFLDVKGCKVSEAAVDRLKVAKPSLIVSENLRLYAVSLPGGYQVGLPWKKPETYTRPHQTPFGEATDTVYKVAQGSDSATVVVTEFVKPPLDRANIEDVVTSDRDKVVQAAGGTLKSDTRTVNGALVIRDVVIEVRGDYGPVAMYVRYVIAGRRLFTLGISAGSFAVPTDVRERFFGSLKPAK